MFMLCPYLRQSDSTSDCPILKKQKGGLSCFWINKENKNTFMSIFVLLKAAYKEHFVHVQPSLR